MLAQRRRRVNLPALRINQYNVTVLPDDSSNVSRLQAQVRNLERTLRARMSELEAADRHITRLEEKLFQLKQRALEALEP